MKTLHTNSMSGVLGLIALARQRGAAVQAHWALNVTNPWTARYLAEQEVARIEAEAAAANAPAAEEPAAEGE